MKFCIVLTTLILFVNISYSQNEVIIRGEDSTHLRIERGNLDVNGQINANNGLILSPSSSIQTTGSIKFENGNFYGYNGNAWVFLSQNSPKYILGPSSITTDGSISYNNLTGLIAANAICKADYPNEPTAHFYHAEEIDEAVRNGNLGIIVFNTNYWSMKSFFRSNGTAASESYTFLNNCFCFLSSGGNSSERGVSVSIRSAAPYAGQLIGIYTNYTNTQTCNNNFRIICGR